MVLACRASGSHCGVGCSLQPDTKPKKEGGGGCLYGFLPVSHALSATVELNMKHKPEWTFSSIAALAFGLLTAWFWWWLIMYQGTWPYIIFAWIPAVPGLAFGIYALRTYESRVAMLAIMLSISPLTTWIMA